MSRRQPTCFTTTGRCFRTVSTVSLTLGLMFGLHAVASAVTIGFGTGLAGVQDTLATDGATNQMRQNINITNTVVLGPGTYTATSWDYLAAPDSTVPGVTQPVFPFLTRVNGPANHTVLAFGATIDTDPGVNSGVAFGGVNDTFTLAGPTTIAAGMQNTNAPGVQNSILTNTGFGNTDHANSVNVDEAGSVGATLDSFGHANLARTYGFSIEVELIPEPSTFVLGLLGLLSVAVFLRRRRRTC